MKKRNGFVTNSSSSCFICQISGREESGMYMSRNDAQMTKCINGHLFGDEFLIDVEISEQDMLNVLIENAEELHKKYLKNSSDSADIKRKQYWKERAEEQLKRIEELESADSIDDYEDEYSELVYAEGVPSIQCPICKFQYALAEDLLAYLLKEERINKDDLLKGIKDRFGSYTNFMEYLRS